MKKKLSLLLATLIAAGSLSAFSSCDLLEIDYLNSLLSSSSSQDSESSSSDSSSSDSSSSDSSSSDSSSEDSSGGDSSSDSSSSGGSSDSSEEKPKPNEPPANEPNIVGGIDFAIAPVTKQYGYQMLEEEDKGEKMQALYRNIYAQCVEFSKNGGDVEAGQQNTYTIITVDCASFGLTLEYGVAVWSLITKDYPEFWWLTHSIWNVGTTMYIGIEEDYQLASTRKAIDTDLQNHAIDCAKYLNDSQSEMERALSIYEFLSANYTYAYDSTGQPSMENWAHNITGGALYNSGVCEMYAKTYEWFCELFDLDCVTITGYGITSTGAEHHAWNAVSIDGEWYGVDATWSNIKDTNKNVYVTRSYFGVGKTEFESKHMAIYPDSYGANYQVHAPTLSEKYLVPVYYGLKGEEKKFAQSLDDAFANMTNATGHYEVELYRESTIITDAGRKLYPNGATFNATQLPQVAQLDLIGRKVYSPSGGYFQSMINFRHSVTLNGNLTLFNLKVDNDAFINTNGYKYLKKSNQ